MALKIRLRRQGRKHTPFYRIIVADSRSPRGGKYVEMLGWYNPLEKKEEKTILLDVERVQHWLSVGAVPTEKTVALIAKIAPDVIKQEKSRAIAKRATRLAKRKERKAKEKNV